MLALFVAAVVPDGFCHGQDSSEGRVMSMPRGQLEMGPEPQASKPAVILVVEDDAMVATYIKDVLEDAGFTVAGVASSGAEALSIADETKPQLALVDICLAGPVDGVDLACRLRERFDLPAIFLSGLADPNTIERARTARPLGFLAKPFLPSQVFNAIERALAG